MPEMTRFAAPLLALSLLTGGCGDAEPEPLPGPEELAACSQGAYEIDAPKDFLDASNTFSEHIAEVMNGRAGEDVDPDPDDKLFPRQMSLGYLSLVAAATVIKPTRTVGQPDTSEYARNNPGRSENVFSCEADTNGDGQLETRTFTTEQATTLLDAINALPVDDPAYRVFRPFLDAITEAAGLKLNTDGPD